MITVSKSPMNDEFLPTDRTKKIKNEKAADPPIGVTGPGGGFVIVLDKEINNSACRMGSFHTESSFLR